jgi:hypothetical protein
MNPVLQELQTPAAVQSAEALDGLAVRWGERPREPALARRSGTKAAHPRENPVRFPVLPQLRNCPIGGTLFTSIATAQDAVWNDSMNTTINDSGRRIGGFSKLEIPVRAKSASENDPQKLAATIEENRVKLEKGWKELARLNRLLATLDAATTGVGPKAPHPGEPTVPTAAGPSPAAVERA